MRGNPYHKMREEVSDGGVTSVFRMDSNGAFHHGVLTHKNNGIATKTLADALKLVGTDIIGTDDEDLRILIEETTEFLIVVSFLLSSGGLENHGGRIGGKLLPEEETLK